MKLKENFDIISKISKGSFGTVYKVLIYALKKVKLTGISPKEKEKAVNETRILASLKHPNIIQYKEAFYDEELDSLCLVMEYAKGGDLFSLIDRKKKACEYLDENTVWSYLIQALKALKYLQNARILHRDIKPANIFLSEDEKSIKIGDFNVSTIIKAGTLAKTNAGTPYYTAPEVYKGELYSFKTDIWSLGCTFYHLMSLKVPFPATDIDTLSNKVQKGIIDKFPSHYSQELTKIITSCLCPNTELRCYADQLLIHPCVLRRITKEELKELKQFWINENLLYDQTKTTKSVNFFNHLILNDILPKAMYENELDCNIYSKSDEIPKTTKLFDLQTSHKSKSIFIRKSHKRNISEANQMLICGEHVTPTNNKNCSGEGLSGSKKTLNKRIRNISPFIINNINHFKQKPILPNLANLDYFAKNNNNNIDNVNLKNRKLSTDRKNKMNPIVRNSLDNSNVFIKGKCRVVLSGKKEKNPFSKVSIANILNNKNFNHIN